MLIDDFLPRHDFNEVHAVEVDAAAEVVYDALMSFDLGKPLIIRLLMGVRSIPSLLKKGKLPSRPEPMTLADAGRAGFTLLAVDPPREAVLGIQGKFWKLRPEVQCVSEAEFRAPIPAGTARAAWNFSVEPLGPKKSRLRTETRILCADETSRRRFGRYWMIVRPGSGIIRWAMLHAVTSTALSRSTAGR